MIIVTGGAGFIGSQIISGLNRKGIDNILAVDNLSNGKKFSNLASNTIGDYMDKVDFRQAIRQKGFMPSNIDCIFHQGACSTTTEWDGRYMMDNNYTYSKELLHFALENSIPFIYASSAAVYGVNTSFIECAANEAPINVYGYSKLLFDNYFRKITSQIKTQVVGLRYFNVYGQGESHKGNMASVAYHFNNQIKETEKVCLFEGSHGYSSGEQLRDFIYVDDVVSVNLWLMSNQQVSGIFNLGTGNANTFNSVADAVIAWHGKGKKSYIPFPDNLLDSYQSFTQADMTKINEAGYTEPFTSIDVGVHKYLDILNA